MPAADVTPTPNTIRSSASQALFQLVLRLVRVGDGLLDRLRPPDAHLPPPPLESLIAWSHPGTARGARPYPAPARLGIRAALRSGACSGSGWWGTPARARRRSPALWPACSAFRTLELDAIYHQAGWQPLALDGSADRVARGGRRCPLGSSTATTPRSADLLRGRADTVVWIDLPRSHASCVSWPAGHCAAVVLRQELWNGNRESLTRHAVTRPGEVDHALGVAAPRRLRPAIRRARPAARGARPRRASQDRSSCGSDRAARSTRSSPASDPSPAELAPSSVSRMDEETRAFGQTFQRFLEQVVHAADAGRWRRRADRPARGAPRR